MKVGVIDFPGSAALPETVEALNRFPNVEAIVVSEDETSLSELDAVILPSGASYGDYLRPGSIAATSPVLAAVRKFALEGKPVLGIGNGFQILTEAGLLPGALLRNSSDRFCCTVAPFTVRSTRTPFTSSYADDQEILLPLANGFGHYWCDPESLTDLQDNDQIVLSYSHDVNGSVDQIAAISNATGNVVGMMAHPQRALEELLGSTDGLPVFTSLISHLEAAKN